MCRWKTLRVVYFISSEVAYYNSIMYLNCVNDKKTSSSTLGWDVAVADPSHAVPVNAKHKESERIDIMVNEKTTEFRGSKLNSFIVLSFYLRPYMPSKVH